MPPRSPWHKEAAEWLKWYERVDRQGSMPTRDAALLLDAALKERDQLLKERDEARAEVKQLRAVLVEVRSWRRGGVGLEPMPSTDPATLGARIDAALADNVRTADSNDALSRSSKAPESIED